MANIKITDLTAYTSLIGTDVIPIVDVTNDQTKKVSVADIQKYYDTDGSNYVAFVSPGTVTSNITWTLPGADGTSGQVLSTNGSGTLSWSTVSTTLSDGDYGDITVSGSGTAFAVDAGAITYAKIQDVSATDKLLGRSTAGSGDVEEITCTAAGRALLDDADAAAQRTTLGLGIGTDVQAYDAQLADVAGLTPSDGNFIVGDGSNFVAESGATARASLGLTIGTDVQAYDAQLADVAGLAVTDGGFIVGDGSNFVLETGATARTSLGVAIGSDVQAYDADTAKTDVAQSFTAQQRGAITALTDGATITADFDVANNFSVTLGGNRTLANPTNLTAGASGCIWITQDGTGSRTLSYGSAWSFSGGTAPTLSTAANAVDCLAYSVRTTGDITATLITNLS